MKTPLCKVCQVTGVLCPSCENKVKSGEISKLDVEVSIFLGKYAKDIRELENVHFKKALYIDNYLVLMFKRGDLPLVLAYGRKLIREMERRFRRKIYVIEDHPNFREFVESLLYPTPVETINIIWLPDGSKETRIVVRGKLDKRREELVKKIIKELRGIEVKVGYI